MKKFLLFILFGCSTGDVGSAFVPVDAAEDPLLPTPIPSFRDPSDIRTSDGGMWVPLDSGDYGGTGGQCQHPIDCSHVYQGCLAYAQDFFSHGSCPPGMTHCKFSDWTTYCYNYAKDCESRCAKEEKMCCVGAVPHCNPLCKSDK